MTEKSNSYCGAHVSVYETDFELFEPSLGNMLWLSHKANKPELPSQ